MGFWWNSGRQGRDRSRHRLIFEFLKAVQSRMADVYLFLQRYTIFSYIFGEIIIRNQKW